VPPAVRHEGQVALLQPARLGSLDVQPEAARGDVKPHAVLAAPFSVQSGAGWIVAGAVLHVVGSFVLTMVANVPLNNRLDAADPDSPAGAEVWADYLVRWTAWNHIRTVLCAAATAALALAV
jgi:uncharacterized membrane protein